MSQLAGIYYFDARPVSAADRDRIASGWNRFSCAPTLWTGPGLLMGCDHGSYSGCSLPELDNACTFDGRLDNVKDLPSPYHRRHPPVPADFALAAYEGGGTEGLRSLIGDWSVVIWDAAGRSIVLASDYAGTRPLYYHRSPDRVIWTSSLQDIVQWTGIGELDEDFVADFLANGMSGVRTPYRGICPVPAGGAIRFSKNRAVTSRYWQFPVGQRVRYSSNGEYEECLRDLLRQAVAARLVTDRSVCAELSGGMDSSSVVCTAHRLIRAHAVLAPQLVGFTYLFPGSTDERFYRAVESACGISSEYLDTAAYPPVAPGCAGFSEPCLWAARFVEVARRMAIHGSLTFLTGQLGDLIFGNWADDSEQAADLVREGKFADSVKEAFAWSRARQVPVYSILWRAFARPQPKMEDTLPAWDCFGRALRERLRARESCLLPPAWLKKARPSLIKRVMGLNWLLDNRALRCPEPLRTLSYSHPFAHRPLVEFMLQIPAIQVCRPGEPRYLQRRALAGILPDPVLRRRSKSNYDAMYSQALRNCAAALLENVNGMRLVQAGYLDRDGLRPRLLRLVKGMEAESSALRSTILLECWLRQRDLPTGESPSRVSGDSPKMGKPQYSDSDCERPGAGLASSIHV